MAVNFPDSPSNGDAHTVNGVTYIYNSTKGAWADNTSGLTALVLDNLVDVDTTSATLTADQALIYNATASRFVANTVVREIAIPTRVYINFKGNDVATGNIPKINVSENVSSITDNNVGSYTVNFDTTLPSKPAVIAAVNNNSVNTNFGVNVNGIGTGSVNLFCIENGNAIDKNEISMVAVTT